MAKKKRRRRKRTPASFLYTILVVCLLAAIVFLAASLYGVYAPPPADGGPARVLVMNGCGVEGIGLRTARFLRSHGHDVVDFRNADHFDYAETIVIDRSGDMDDAIGVARLLKTPNVIQQMPETPLVDVAVIVGKDYGRFLPE